MTEYDFMYEHTDIPEGMTIREWRAQRAVERAAAQARDRARRRRRITAPVRRVISGLRQTLRPRVLSRS